MPETTTQSRSDTRPRPISPSMSAIGPRDFGYDHARHLLWRAAFGGTPEQVRAMAEMGPRDAVDYLLDFKASHDLDPGPQAGDLNNGIMRPLTQAEQQQYRDARRRQDEETLARFRRERQNRQRNDRQQMRELQKGWLARLIQSPRPLEEKLTLFWHGHFATSYRGVENSYHMFMQNQLFRTNAA
ncbi:MAG: DUF1800 family protein, partial [Planctomycetota bacterium]